MRESKDFWLSNREWIRGNCGFEIRDMKYERHENETKNAISESIRNYGDFLSTNQNSEDLGSISPAFYEHLFCVKMCCTYSMYLQ